jgi:hypothetical protein
MARGKNPRMGYRAGLDWLLDNDDTDWLDDECGSPSVTLCLLADLMGIDQDRAVADLRRRRDKRESEA